MASFALAKNFEGGALDTMDVELSGEVLLCGWSRISVLVFRVVADGCELQCREEFRLRRPDLGAMLGPSATHQGFGMVFHLPADWTCEVLEVRLQERALVSIWPGMLPIASTGLKAERDVYVEPFDKYLRLGRLADPAEHQYQPR